MPLSVFRDRPVIQIGSESKTVQETLRGSVDQHQATIACIVQLSQIVRATELELKYGNPLNPEQNRVLAGAAGDLTKATLLLLAAARFDYQPGGSFQILTTLSRFSGEILKFLARQLPSAARSLVAEYCSGKATGLIRQAYFENGSSADLLHEGLKRFDGTLHVEYVKDNRPASADLAVDDFLQGLSSFAKAVQSIRRERVSGLIRKSIQAELSL